MGNVGFFAILHFSSSELLFSMPTRSLRGGWHKQTFLSKTLLRLASDLLINKKDLSQMPILDFK